MEIESEEAAKSRIAGDSIVQSKAKEVVGTEQSHEELIKTVQSEEEKSVGAAPTERLRIFNEEKYTRFVDVFQTALATEGATPPFAGNLEDPVYTAILAGLRVFNPDDFPDPPEAEEDGGSAQNSKK